MKIPFKYYVHDDNDSMELRENIEDQFEEGTGTFSEEFWEKVGKPFYEVTLHCELDTETGQVRLLRAEL